MKKKKLLDSIINQIKKTLHNQESLHLFMSHILIK